MLEPQSNAQQDVRKWKAATLALSCVGVIGLVYSVLPPMGSISAADFLTANAFEGFRVTDPGYDYLDSPFANLSATGDKVHWLKFEGGTGDRGRFAMKVASDTFEGEWNISDRTFVNLWVETVDGRPSTGTDDGGLFLRLPRHPDDPLVITSFWEVDSDSPLNGVLVVRSRGAGSWWKSGDGSTRRPSRLVVRPGRS